MSRSLKIGKVILYASVGIIVILSCSCESFDDNQDIPPRIAIWGDTNAWEKIDKGISSYYFIGYVTEKTSDKIGSERVTFPSLKYECAYIRPRTYIIKEYEAHGSDYSPQSINYDDDNQAWEYSYLDNTIIDRSNEKHSFNLEPQTMMSYFGSPELEQVFNCMETRFPLPPKGAENKGTVKCGQKTCGLFVYQINQAFGKLKYKINSQYAIDPLNGRPANISIQYHESGKHLLLWRGPRWLLRPLSKIIGQKYEDVYDIRYQDIEFNLPENVIKEKFQLPSNAHYGNGRPIQGRWSDDKENRFNGCMEKPKE